MKNVTKVICAIIIICLLASCTFVSKDNNTNGTTTPTKDERNLPETSVLPEPMAQNSNEKKSHSYGVAKDGKPNEISINNQKYFEENNFNAFCLDTKSKDKVLYLTFDCGYENGYTEKILDVLKEKKVNAAFFCTLPQVKENPELIKRMISEGHIVGNHSVTHPSFAEISTEQVIEEIKGMEKYLKENYKYSEPYFRFPKGEYTENALKTVNSLGYSCAFWSLAYADWDLNSQKGEQFAFDKVVSRFHPGAVILLHSVSPDNANALGRIIDEARSQGYEFLSLRDYVSN
jgi:peptidoglycan-N-acetylmuramic acid deacetylase